MPALPNSSRETPLSLLITAMALVTVPLIAACEFLAYLRTDVVDDQMFGYFGWRIAHGATVYLDVWDNKPPGIYWINAIGFLVGFDTYWGVIAMCVIALLVAHICFFCIGASLWSREGAAIATVIMSCFLTHGYFTGGTNRTETFLVACELAAVLLYVRGFARDKSRAFFLAGVMCGVAFTFKQVGLAAWGAMGLHLIVLGITRELDWGRVLKRGVLLVLGTATILAAASAYLAWQGAFHEALFATFVFNRSYFDTGTSKLNSITNRYLMFDHIWPILRLPLLMACAAAIHATLWSLRPKHRPAALQESLVRLKPVAPRMMILFAVWWAAATYGSLLSPHGFRHYVVPSIPPLLLMAGSLVNVLLAEQKLLQRMQQSAWVACAFVAIGYFAWDAGQRQLQQSMTILLDRWGNKETLQWQPSEWEFVGEAIQRLSKPTDKIQCWGYLPGVYLYARRENACRFITTEKPGQVGKKAGFVLEEIRDKLESVRPELIVLKPEDWHWMTGEDKSKPTPEIDLTPFIEANYVRVEEVMPEGRAINVYIYKRKDLVPATHPSTDPAPRGP